MNRAIPSVPPGVVAKSEPYANTTRDFFRIASISTAIGFGCGAGSLQSLHWNSAGLFFQISRGTFVAFIIGAALTMLYWKAVTHSATTARIGTGLLVVAGIGLFLYPLRFVPAEKLPEIATGLGFAVIALSTVACLLWQLKRYFEQG